MPREKQFSLKDFIRGHLRRCFARTLFATRALLVAKEVYFEGKKRRVRFTCAKCLMKFDRKQVHIDHINPVAPVDGHDPDYNEFVALLFTDKLQILCEDCHHAKSAIENNLRRENKKKLAM